MAKFHTRNFSPKRRRTAAQERARDELRRERIKARTARYRKSLIDRKAPDARHLADALLAEFLLNHRLEDSKLAGAWIKRLSDAGFAFDEIEAKAVKLKKRLLSNAELHFSDRGR